MILLQGQTVSLDSVVCNSPVLNVFCFIFQMKCEETMVELNGAKRKLTLAEEQLQKALREKAAIAMEVGKTNDKNLKSQEVLTSMENEMNNCKRLLEDSEKHARDTESKLQKVWSYYY